MSGTPVIYLGRRPTDGARRVVVLIPGSKKLATQWVDPDAAKRDCDAIMHATGWPLIAEPRTSKQARSR